MGSPLRTRQRIRRRRRTLRREPARKASDGSLLHHRLTSESWSAPSFLFPYSPSSSMSPSLIMMLVVHTIRPSTAKLAVFEVAGATHLSTVAVAGFAFDESRPAAQ